MSNPLPTDPLAAFLPPTRAWFIQTLGQSTPPQRQGWPAIQQGEHTLILAPTGSGKTLTAFLWGIDHLYRDLLAAAGRTWQELPDEDRPSGSEQEGTLSPEQLKPSRQKGKGRPTTNPLPELRLLYISPLKALNNDIERNLRVPLAGISRTAQALGGSLPTVEVAVRSGDTPSRERQAMVRRPPHILITTPESLYILLTSPNGRELFRTLRTVIVDEIHTLAGSKRGVHLALSLERLQQVAQQPLQRIGLSATIRPLDEVARYLGGSSWQPGDATPALTPRPVTIVDTGYRKPMELQVETVVEDFRNLPGDSIWPTVIDRVAALIDQHHTTLVFANNRRLAERAADWLNEVRAPAEPGGEGSSGMERVAHGLGMLGAGRGIHPDPIRAHHGSISKETRLELEQALKAGSLPALVGTSSLELGIDIGAVDLVVQLQSPKSVAQGLQRVGRAGHLVGQTSRGHIFPTHREEVLEAATVAGGMLRGEVEPLRTPRNALDVLAQQIVAMVSVEEWGVEDLYNLVRCAYPYRDLTQRAFQAVLEMLAGRFSSRSFRELRPRLVWDRVNQRLAALPGSRLLALTNGGTISDRGAFGAYLADGKTKLGELDEEFVYETRVGDTLMLGSQVWRVVELSDDRVTVVNAAGATPRMPFWRGDFPWRPYELGARVGAFRRTVAERLLALRRTLDLPDCRSLRRHLEAKPVQALLGWLGQEYALDANSAWQVVDYVAGQLDQAGAISSDRTVLVELFDDPLGDPRMVIQAPFGGRVNGLWALALAGALRERTGVAVEVESNDDGILCRFPAGDGEFPLDFVSEVGVDEARERILAELPNSAVFGAQFRQNAARALLLPGQRGGKRTPFWLQRLRAKDLLQIVRQYDDFPVVAETYRDCLEEVMDWPHLEEVLHAIAAGEIQVTVVESLTPSPVAQSLLWDFISIYLYEWDTPKAERQLRELGVNRDLLQDLLVDVDLADLLRPEAVAEVRDRLQRTAPSARTRTAEELASLFQTVGDLSSGEVAARCTVDPAAWIWQLAGAGRILSLTLPTAQGDANRWVAAENLAEYAAAFALSVPEELSVDSAGTAEPLTPDVARRRILLRFLEQAGPVTLGQIRARYAFPAEWLQATLDGLVEMRELAHGRFTPTPDGVGAQVEAVASAEYLERRTLEQMHRRTLTILRQAVRPVPFSVYADFLTRWQHLHPESRLTGAGGLRQILQQLRAAPVVGPVWERDLLPLRLLAPLPQAEVAALCQSGELVWVGSGGSDPRRARIRFLFRGEGALYLEPAPSDLSALDEQAQQLYAFLGREGALFQAELQAGTGLAPAVVETALQQLIMAGLVTNDSLGALRQFLQTSPAQAGGQPAVRSSLEAQLAVRRRHDVPRPMGGVRRPSRQDYRAAQRRVRERLAGDEGGGTPSSETGRWSLVHRFGVLGSPLPPAERTARQARQLLARYGVVTHASLEGEVGAWDWASLYLELQRLELRGEVRRGYFVQGLAGVQFALPQVVEQLRALAQQVPGLNVADAGVGSDGEGPLVLINACDPANLYGSALEATPQTAAGEPLTFVRLPSTWLILERGLPLLLIEDSGARLTTMQGVTDGVAQRAVATWLAHAAHFSPRIQVGQWNGTPVLQSPGQPLLEALGFHRDYPRMTWIRP